MAERRTDRPLRIRLTDGERSVLDAAARLQGQGTSTWARTVLMSAAGQPEPQKNRPVAAPKAEPARKAFFDGLFPVK